MSDRARTVEERRDELAAGLAAVEHRIETACAAAGRRRSQVTLVVVTKTFPAADVMLLAGLGVRDFGENRDQEAAGKAEQLAGVDGAVTLHWHFVGQLQRNKTGSVAQYADAVHSLDRVRLVTALDRAAVSAERHLDVLLQVDLDASARRASTARGGVPETQLAELAEVVNDAEALRLRGIMAIAPLGQSPRAAFGRLAEVAHTLRQQHPDADWISAGMSGDLEDAIACGATHLRVGSAILGSRASLQ